MKKSMKRLIAIVCVAVMLCGVISSVNLGQVQATDASTTAGTPEKTVDVQELTEGTVKPGSLNIGDTEEKYTKEGYVFGGYYDDYNPNTKKFSNPITEERDASQNSIFIRWVPEEVMNMKAQVREDEYKKVISNCDGIADGSNDYNITSNAKAGEPYTAEGYVQEGFASLGRDANINSAAVFNLNLKDVVDVTGYKYFSCKLYISDASALGKDSNNNCLNIVLSSAGATNKSGALRFYVTYDELQDYQMEGETGWYELMLPFAQADYINVASSDSVATYNGAAINFVQIRQGAAVSGSTDTVTMCIDDICVLNDNPGVVLADCDQMYAPNATDTNSDHSFTYVKAPGKGGSGTNSVIKDNVKEGTGALKVACFKHTTVLDYRMFANIYMSDANKINIKSYMETGYLHFWLYLGNQSYLSDKIVINLTSDSSTAKKYVRYRVEESELQTGWNEILLPLNSYYASTDDFSSSAVNFIQIYSIGAASEETYQNNDAYMLVDDIRVVHADEMHQQITDCDTKTGITFKTTNPSVTTTDDAKEGSGVFEYTWELGCGVNTIYRIILDTPVDFTNFKGTTESPKNGSLHFWLYIENALYMKGDVSITLGSTGNVSSTEDQKYTVSKENITSGWNEIYINLDDITAGPATAAPDWTSINCMNIAVSGGFSESCITKIDDIALVSGNAKKVDVRFVSTVESLGYQKVGYKITPSRGTEKLTTLTTEATDVYQKLFAMNNNGETDDFEASIISGLGWSEYMHAATVTNIPNRLWDATFTIVPYWITQDGTTVTGKAEDYTINYLLNASRQNASIQELTPIDIYLIAGQSNAGGNSRIVYDSDGDEVNELDVTETLQTQDARYIDGFTNILYSGTYEKNSVGIARTRANVHSNDMMGPEVGMAKILSTYYNEENGNVAGFIKYAIGGSSLTDTAGKSKSETYGNWVSPSYEATLEQVNYGELTGKLYENLLAQVEKSLGYYEQLGYEPVIKGLYWMQGENNRNQYDEYAEAFTYFASDIRKDLSTLTGEDLSKMPIMLGTISATYDVETETATSDLEANSNLIAVQKQLVKDLSYCYLVDNSGADYYICVTNDNGATYVPTTDCTDMQHWSWSQCLSIGQNVGNIILENILGVTE